MKIISDLFLEHNDLLLAKWTAIIIVNEAIII